jgi:serine/threonine-protein kinase
MDFGIAKIVGAGTRLTGTGGVLGTFDYIAPEQIQAAAGVDRRADVYSLGVMAYQMLTGELPFKRGNLGALLIAHLHQPAPDPRQVTPGLPDKVAEAVMRAMAKEPIARHATAGEFVAEIAQN